MISQYVEPEFNIDDIVARMSREDWTRMQAVYWISNLKGKGFKIVDPIQFYREVRERFQPFHDEMIEFMRLRESEIKTNKKVRTAEKKVCQNPLHETIVLDTLHVPGHELETLQEFYCPTCNRFWREP